MKKKLFLIAALAAILLIVSGFTVFADNTEIYFTAVEGDMNTVIKPQTLNDGSRYLFLPSSADMSALKLYFDPSVTVCVKGDESKKLISGEAFDVGQDECELEITVGGESSTVTVMHSSSLRSMYIVSSDAENKGREWVDSSKANEAKGTMSFVDKNGKISHSDKLTQIKARGNSTFTDFEKKAYQIKLDKKADLIGGVKAEASKKWILLANAADITLMHNSITFSLAEKIGIPYTNHCESIDLYYDGEYRGNYLLTEKVEVASSRVDIDNLDDMIEELNADNDAYNEPVVLTKTFADGGNADAKINSAGSFKYVDGLIEPQLPEGADHHAYLLEIDFIYRYADEQSGFVTNRGQAVVTKNPEYLTKETGLFISSFWQEFEDAVFSPNGFNEKTGKYYYEYCDLDSLAKIYLIHEFTKNYDSFRSSSFFCLPAGSDIMYACPVWDFDICYGTGYNGNRQTAANPENFFAATKYMLSELVKIESFRDAVKALLDSENGEFYKAVMSLLGEDGEIRSLAASLSDSQKMNYKLWDISAEKITALFCGDECTYENAVSFLEYFVSERVKWLSEITAEWEGSSYSLMTDPSFPKTYRYHTDLRYIEAKAVTCTEDGNTAGLVCDDCKAVLTESKVLPSGHNWKSAECKNAKTCKRCGLTEGEPLGHDIYEAFDDPAYTETYHVYKCRRCSYKFAVTVAPRLKGDADGNGKLTVSDARKILRAAMKLDVCTETMTSLCDMNGNGKIDVSDARIVLRKALGIE